ncbi:shikimate dehydrogenase [Sphingobium sp. B7D2B]|uniref:shikimate dehydrogenase family protein n=1 Tax=unclassified Sphingobium TaxID=2611147 RepID=UPI0022257DBD|nr:MULTISPECIES: shikimate dehydrogenase [unclassified Sphingobium]MCW2348805.1 shikimate dehydrogenase [Sphingobium sp. B12D2B]MCW2364733.1 shikimate dehydrogenase [Sphingobium sp. B7D2B]
MSQGKPYAEVIGDPIAHSKSPVIHNFWLEELGIDAEYRKTRVAPEDLAGYFLRRRADPDWLGCNITIPHKIAALDYVDDPGGVRDRIGAINTVACETGGPLIGTNTDAGGFLQPLLARGWSGTSAILAGTGGAAQAIGFALRSVGVTDLTIVARDAAKGQALLDRLGLAGRVQGFDAALPAADLLANSTSLGMVGQPAWTPDLSPLPDKAMVYDIVYAPLETPLLAAARKRDLMCIDGLEMLIGQAALAFDIFFDAQPPRELDAQLRERLLVPA